MATKAYTNVFFGFQIFLRLLAVASTFVGAYIIVSTKQTVVVYGISVDASYIYSSADKFFAYANCAACAFSVITFFCVLLFNPWKTFIIFLHDLVMENLLMAGCAAATAFGFIGKYGNDHIGWVGICDHFAEYCDKVSISVACSYVAVMIYFILTIMSAFAYSMSRNSSGSQI